MKTFTLSILLLVMTVTLLSAQEFTLQADIRPRFEYRHGYGSLFSKESGPAAAIGQRSRLNLGYAEDKLSIGLSVQDVSVWGDTRQLSATDDNHSFFKPG